MARSSQRQGIPKALNPSREQGIPGSPAAKRVMATAGRAALCPSCRAGYMRPHRHDGRPYQELEVVEAWMCDDCGYVRDST